MATTDRRLRDRWCDLGTWRNHVLWHERNDHGCFQLAAINRLLLNLETTVPVRQVIYGVVILAIVWVYVLITGQRSD